MSNSLMLYYLLACGVVAGWLVFEIGAILYSPRFKRLFKNIRIISGLILVLLFFLIKASEQSGFPAAYLRRRSFNPPLHVAALWVGLLAIIYGIYVLLNKDKLPALPLPDAEPRSGSDDGRRAKPKAFIVLNLALSIIVSSEVVIGYFMVLYPDQDVTGLAGYLFIIGGIAGLLAALPVASRSSLDSAFRGFVSGAIAGFITNTWLLLGLAHYMF